MTQGHAVDVHRPKVEYFDLVESTNTDPKGFVRPVDIFHVEPWGLYMARTADHPQFHYLESWLLPELSLRATVFHFRPTHDRDQDYYLDIGSFGPSGPHTWTSVDHYLDIVVRRGREAVLLDVDELLAAHTAGYLTLAEAQQAVDAATRTVDGIASHAYDFEAWLRSRDIIIGWRDRLPGPAN